MKKIQCVASILLILFLFVGCSQKQSNDTDMTPAEMVNVITESQSELTELSQITFGDNDFSSYLSDYYLLNSEQINDGAICYADGTQASEIAVLILNDVSDAKAIEETLNQYIENRSKVFEGYAPQQAAMVKNGEIVTNDKYVALLICEDTASAKNAFLSCFRKNQKVSSTTEAKSESVTEPNKKEDSDKTKDEYDADAVLQAWKTGDTSSLSDINLTILNAAKDVIKTEIKDTMTDYEKELVMHDWITNWSSFDYSVFSRSSDEFKDGSDTPYGVLIDKVGMCHGYSLTFQLFMDMLDIECMTVYGTPDSNGVEHSWNMVKLDGDWYCVDVAWDDPIGSSPGHRFFNVTSKYLRDSGIHNWDEASVPEATATKYSYQG